MLSVAICCFGFAWLLMLVLFCLCCCYCYFAADIVVAAIVDLLLLLFIIVAVVRLAAITVGGLGTHRLVHLLHLRLRGRDVHPLRLRLHQGGGDGLGIGKSGGHDLGFGLRLEFGLCDADHLRFHLRRRGRFRQRL